MIPLGTLGQVYFVCAAIGVLFIGINVVLGQLDDIGDSSGADGGDAGGADFGGDGGDAGGADFGGDGGDAGGADGGDSGGGDGADHGSSTKGEGLLVLDMGPAGHRRFKRGLGRLILSLISPMTIATFLAFFGLGGLAAAYACPFLGIFTLVPAFATAVAVSYIVRKFLALIIKHLHTTSHAKQSDLIGQVAEVITPMHDGRQGEVTYIIQSKRINHSAKPAKQGVNIPKGSKVLIVEAKDHLVLVEPYGELLEERLIS